MITRDTRRTVRSWRRLTAGLVLGLCLAPAPARAQSSANFALSPGKLTASSGSASSANFRLVGEGDPMLSRSNSGAHDIVPGFIGGAFTSKATIQLSLGAETYAPVAFPVVATSNLVSSMLSSLGGVDHSQWRFGAWSPADSGYIEAGGSPDLPTIDRGRGYWLITKDARNLSISGLPAHPTNPYKILLTSGPSGRPAWNMLGNPFLYPVPVSLMFVDGGGLGVFNVTAGANILTEHVIKVRSGSSYADATVVNGRTAFWIRKIVSPDVTLYIPAIPAATGSPAPALQKPEGSSWAVALTALQDGTASERLWLGAAPLARAGWNAMAASRVPSPPDREDLGLFVHRAGWSEMSGDYVRDFQPAAQRMSWDVTLAGAQGPGEVGIALEGFDVPAGMRFFLTDPVAGWTREVKPGDGIHVAVGTAARSLRFEAALGGTPVETTPATDGFRVAYPNPFRGTTGLSFTLARPGAIQADIFDVQGRVVRSLRNTNASAGDHVLVWDGSDRNGSHMGSGVYLVRWRAGAATGVARLIRVD